jgi:hypothetical protein
MTSNINEINITRHLERFQKVLGETGIPTLALLTCVSDIAVEIKRSLISQETLAINKEGQTPILECNSTECYMWALLLTSAWTQWVFTAKVKNPVYQNDVQHPEAAQNVKIALPYIKQSINDAISVGNDVGGRADLEYNPNSSLYDAKIKLRKYD